MTLSFGLFGCGVMGQRHIKGMAKLRQAGRMRFSLEGVCDLIPSSAERAADLAEALLGKRPRVFASFAEMRTAIPLDGISITTQPDAHLDLGLEALQAGVNVMVEKPIALTARQGKRLFAAARETGCKLAVAENYRRDPINRLAKALIDAGAIGRPFLAVQASSNSGEFVIITPWRHLRRKCGIVIDMGVHYTDILEYLLGPIEVVVGMNAVVDTRRRGADGVLHPADAEDLSVGVVRFKSGALGNWMLSMAGRGAGYFHRAVYGDGGSLIIPMDRTGHPLQLTVRRDGKDILLSEAEQLALVPDFALDPTTAALFGGERLSSYCMEFADIDANLIAVEYDDFAGAILEDRPPEVSGEDGLRSLALVYGFLEAERLGRPVTAEALLSGEISAYQDELEGIATDQP
ncbi:MAG: oxidoreductase [Candidatus Roseilinea sp.]|nr:MAG: oxidoreductase [Candidatus Roseilinea sp.]